MDIVIHRINFPIYETIIVFSILIAQAFIYIQLRKKIEDRKILLRFIFMNLVFIIFGGKLLTILANFQVSYRLRTTSISSYGSFIGLIISTIIFTKIYHFKKSDFMKVAILSLPLTYSIGKLACFFAGCCYGLEYNGPFKMIYDKFEMTLFPVQLLEVITFMILFLVLLKVYKKCNKNICEKVIISSCVLKGVLDFFRYEHTEKLISTNQLISIGLILITVIYMKIKQSRKIKNNENIEG